MTRLADLIFVLIFTFWPVQFFPDPFHLREKEVQGQTDLVVTHT